MDISTANSPAIAACVFEVRIEDDAIQLFPAGLFDAINGAMLGKGPWLTSAEIAAKVIARVAARKNDIVIDYNHQTIRSADNGQPAPAAGWVKPDSLEWREGEGIFARSPKWTDKAAAAIDADEYRYISPVFPYDPKTGEVLDVLQVALTNFAAIDGMEEVGARAAASCDLFHQSNQPQEESYMKKLLAALGMEPNTTEDEAVAACTALIQKNTDLASQAATHSEAIAAAAAATPETAVAAMQSLQTKVAALTAKINGNELDGLVAAALADGRLTPAQEPWARETGKRDLAALSGFLETAQPIAALSSSQTEDKDLDDKGGTELSETVLAVCGQMGVSAEDYQKTLEA